MSKKSILYSIIIVVLVAVLFFQRSYQNRQYVQSTGRFFDIDSTSDVNLKIFSSTDTIGFSREMGKWKIVYPIVYEFDETKKSSIEDQILKVESTTLPISKNSENYHFYKVADTAYDRKVEFSSDGSPTQTIFFGQSENYSTSFARRGEEVFELTTNIVPTMNTSLLSWVDRTLLQIDKNSIFKLNVQTKDGKYTLVNSDTLWQFVENSKETNIKADNTKLNNILSVFSNFRFINILYKDKSEYERMLETPEYVVDIDAVEPVQMVASKYDENSFIVSLNNYFYQVANSSFESLIAKKKDFE